MREYFFLENHPIEIPEEDHNQGAHIPSVDNQSAASNTQTTHEAEQVSCLISEFSFSQGLCKI
jgi:hypothetical protein